MRTYKQLDETLNAMKGEKLIMSKLFINFVYGLLKGLRNDFYNKNSMLAKKNLEVIKWC